jgi:hypothetical protein
MNNIDFFELKDRISRSVRGHPNDDYRACCWQGYIAALLEWGLITPNEHFDLLAECKVSSSTEPSTMIFLE